MKHWILIGLAIGLLAGPGLALAQGDPPQPACTTTDLTPVSRIVTGMVDDMDREDGFTVDNLLRWRAEIAALDVPDCAGMKDAVLQLQLASDELLIGALLLDRTATVQDAAALETLTSTATVAINIGLTNLVGMRFTLAEVDAEPAALPFGDLTGTEVLAAFEAAGLPLADVTPDAGPAGGAAPVTERERITFSLPEVFDGGMGQVLVFADPASRDAWLAYLFTELADPGYVYTYQNVIVQLTPELDRGTALRFRAVLRALE